MRYQRAQRVGDLMKREIGDIIETQLKDPRIGFITVTAVMVSVDLRHAKVFFSVFGDEQVWEKTRLGLESARYFIQGEIGRRLRLKYTPELIFEFDRSVEYGFHIDKIIKELQEEHDEEPEGSDDSS